MTDRLIVSVEFLAALRAAGLELTPDGDVRTLPERRQAELLKSLGVLQSLQLAIAALVAGAGFDEAAWQAEGFPNRAHVEQLVLRLHRDLGRFLSGALPPSAPTDAPPVAPSHPDSGKSTPEG